LGFNPHCFAAERTVILRSRPSSAVACYGGWKAPKNLCFIYTLTAYAKPEIFRLAQDDIHFFRWVWPTLYAQDAAHGALYSWLNEQIVFPGLRPAPEWRSWCMPNRGAAWQFAVRTAHPTTILIY